MPLIVKKNEIIIMFRYYSTSETLKVKRSKVKIIK